MRLPWRKTREEPAAAAEPRPGMADAGRAVAAARGAVAESRERGPAVAHVVARLRSLREENHISARFDQAVRDGYTGRHHAGGD
jgi:hypothetical protein